MRYIAIIKGKWIDPYDDYSVKIIESITNWSEVSEEDYNLLNRWARNHDYIILERMDVKPDFIPKTIAACKEEARIYAEKQRMQREEAARKKLERELKRKAKNEEQERKLLEELERKYKADKDEIIRTKVP